MKSQIIGVQPIQFTNNNGEEIKGTNIYIAFKDENVTGLRAEKIFLKNGIELPKDTKINDTVEIAFNFKGKIESISKAN
ncbi:hypothetical protein IAI10_03740 [Clostridium sp. 19966]|uniref:hypothetical protein n=1 Tax=Clostridium sp. 19966 TaxID=2768166 RepID=UPI0028E02633|nr:hypothetical protein [Clostridium sp. 19966]MDT8715762.1 hypothetical protein [Clostridium sp. 19966]